MRQPLQGLDVNILTMACEINALEAENATLARQNAALRRQDERKTGLISAFCSYHSARPAR